MLDDIILIINTLNADGMTFNFAKMAVANDS